jgi:hypothetical protein
MNLSQFKREAYTFFISIATILKIASSVNGKIYQQV